MAMEEYVHAWDIKCFSWRGDVMLINVPKVSHSPLYNVQQKLTEASDRPAWGK
jgi:hypothetical protein